MGLRLGARQTFGPRNVDHGKPQDKRRKFLRLFPQARSNRRVSRRLQLDSATLQTKKSKICINTVTRIS